MEGCGPDFFQDREQCKAFVTIKGREFLEHITDNQFFMDFAPWS